MSSNPFANALNSAIKVLVNDYTLRFIYENIPEELGGGAAYMPPPANIILLPKIDTSLLTRDEQRKYTANVYHETRHHALTGFNAFEKACQDSEMLRDLTNAIEDARIERCPFHTLEGGKQDLTEDNLERSKRLSDKLKENIEIALNNRWGWIIKNIVYTCGQYGSIPVHPEMERYWEIAENILSDGRFNDSIHMYQEGTDISLELAKEILQQWQIKRNEEFDKNNEKGEGENGQGDNQNNPPSEKDSENDSQSEQNSNNSEEGNEEDNEEGNKENQSKEEDSEERPKSIRKEYEKDKKNPKNEELKKLLDPNERNKEVAGMGKPGDMKDFQDNWWAKKHENNDYNRFRPHIGDVYIPYNTNDREIIAKPNEEGFHHIEDSIRDRVARLQEELAVILRSSAQCQTSRFQKRGRIDYRSLHRAAVGHKNIKKIVHPGIQLNAAVSLVLDLSGSMSGPKATLAAQIATLFGEALVNIPEIAFEIRGYNTSPMINGSFYEMSEEEKKLIEDGWTRTEVINHWVFKLFSENWRNVRYRMGACLEGFRDANPEAGGAVGGCNCDHENLILAAHKICERPEQNKIMIVLCDGLPSGYNGTYGGLLEDELHKTVQKIRNAGIKLFCFGMHCPIVENFYSPDVEVVNSLENMDESALKKLAYYLLRNQPH